MSEKSLTEKIENQVARVVGFVQSFIQRHPILALVFLSLLLIVAALIWNSSRSEQQEKTSPAEERILTEKGASEEVRDFNESQFPLTPKGYREEQAYNEYQKEIREAEEAAGQNINDHFDGSEEAIIKREQFVKSLRGMYDLPYRGKTMQAKYVEVVESAAGTRYLIAIGYLRSRKAAQREWKEYLRSKGDQGEYYITEYFRIPH